MGGRYACRCASRCRHGRSWSTYAAYSGGAAGQRRSTSRRVGPAATIAAVRSPDAIPDDGIQPLSPALDSTGIWPLTTLQILLTPTAAGRLFVIKQAVSDIISPPRVGDRAVGVLAARRQRHAFSD